MTNLTAILGSGLILLTAVVGCEPVDYYPNHETPQQSGDLRKQGPGGYGGNNSDYPVGTPGTAGTSQPATPPVENSIPSQLSGGPTFTTSGQGTFSQTGSYSGANTGGASAADQSISPGTTTTGTASGH